MRISTIALITTFTTVATIAAATRNAVHADVADLYFACSSGYTFSVKGSAARCFKAGSTQTATPHCPAGSQLTVDFSGGNRDECVKGSNVSHPGCSTGYSIDVNNGADRCVKTTPDDIKAPTVQVTL